MTSHLKNLRTNFKICEECFNNDNIPAGSARSEFEPTTLKAVLSDQTLLAIEEYERNSMEIDKQNKLWSNQETNHLLELVKDFGEDWEKISVELKTGRTPKECIY